MRNTTEVDHTPDLYPDIAKRPARRRRWLRKAGLGGLLVLTGMGAQKSGVLSPEETLQLATLPEHSTLVMTPDEADREARATPVVVKNADAFAPERFASRVGVEFQQGEASYYGAEFAGRKTANGERFDPAEMTAAHRTLPLGSVVRVTNDATGASAVLRVNDRGPYAKDRVIDVSHAAAKVLGMERSGTADVRIEVL